MRNHKTLRTVHQKQGGSISDLLDEKAAADFLQLSPGTLSVWRSTGRYGIPFLKIGHLVRYRRSVLETWLESRTRSSGATE